MKIDPVSCMDVDPGVHAVYHEWEALPLLPDRMPG